MYLYVCMSWNLIKYAMESVIVDYFIQHIDLAIFTLFTLAETTTTNVVVVVDQDYQCVQSIASWLGKYVIKLWQCCRLIKSRQPRHGRVCLSACLSYESHFYFQFPM